MESFSPPPPQTIMKERDNIALHYVQEVELTAYENASGDEKAAMGLTTLLIGVAASCWPNYFLCPDEKQKIGGALFAVALITSVLACFYGWRWWVKAQARQSIVDTIRKKPSDDDTESTPAD